MYNQMRHARLYEKTSMKINPRYYPLIIITAYVVFLLFGILLGFGPERGTGSHGRGALLQLTYLALVSLL